MKKIMNFIKDYWSSFAIGSIFGIITAVLLAVVLKSIPQEYESEPLMEEVHYKNLCIETNKKEDCMRAHKLTAERQSSDEMIDVLKGIEHSINVFFFIFLLFAYIGLCGLIMRI